MKVKHRFYTHMACMNLGTLPYSLVIQFFFMPSCTRVTHETNLVVLRAVTNVAYLTCQVMSRAGTSHVKSFTFGEATKSKMP